MRKEKKGAKKGEENKRQKRKIEDRGGIIGCRIRVTNKRTTKRQQLQQQ